MSDSTATKADEPTKRTKKRKRRVKSPHPGIVLVERAHRSGRRTWEARWRSPWSGRMTAQGLASLGLTNDKMRTTWAKSVGAHQAMGWAGQPAYDPIDRDVMEDVVNRADRHYLFS